MKHTHDWIYDFLEQPATPLKKLLTPDLMERIAFLTGKQLPTIYGYIRPHPTDREYNNTGSPSPFNEVVQYVAEIHRTNPDGARELAGYFTAVCDVLDLKISGGAETEREVLRSAAEATRHSSGAVEGVLADGLDLGDLEQMKAARRSLDHSIALAEASLSRKPARLAKVR